MRFCLNFTLALLAAACVTPSLFDQDIRQLSPITPKPTAAYPDNADGLRHLLQDMLTAAQRRDQNSLHAMIANTEIPDYETWFPAMFGAQKGDNMAISYSKILKQREIYLQDEITKLAGREGYLTTKEIVATDLYDTLQKQLDVFLASWSPPDSAGLPRRPTPIAYFFFVDGKFRWNSTVTFDARSAQPSEPQSTGER